MPLKRKIVKTFYLFLLTCLIYTPGISQINVYDSVPVRLSSLEAGTVAGDAKLIWKVVCFLEYAKFEVQRSANGVNYSTINSFEADRLRCRQPFSFTDANVSGKAFYRIRVGDIDGRVYHSKIVTAVGKENGFEINSLTPTIISSSSMLSISSSTGDKAEVVVANFQGIVVKRFTINVNKGVTEILFDAGSLPKGSYILTLTNRFSDLKTIRFSKI